jgi:hypothetical protein
MINLNSIDLTQLEQFVQDPATHINNFVYSFEKTFQEVGADSFVPMVTMFQNETDVAVTITVEWLDISNVVLYSVSNNYGLTGFNEQFDYGLTQMLTANPVLINDNNFFGNKMDLRVAIDSGNQALALANDLFATQQCYNVANNIRTNSVYYFNINS